MTRKRNRSTAGLINTSPFTLSYSVTGALTSWVNATSSGQYDKYDNLAQEFSAGRQLRQDQVIRPQNIGIVDLELAGRYYYGADDRLMVVQRYSYRNSGFSDGTWEEYWYDALGRRVFTRARRERTSPYDATVSGPLCVGASNLACRSFTERVWWDGDQSLVEERLPEGAQSDVSSSGLVGNIHALTLDEPLAVVTPQTSETRIINYNWRGQGMSSVYPNGRGADYATDSAVAEIDWPAMTQAQTYFTPSLDETAPDNNPKKWMGTFVQNGQGTTTMLYRRNRYFDPTTGRFTQEDPIGIAGGVNAYGFANGDPINFNDPFGLTSCPPDCNDDTDTSRPERDPAFKAQLDAAGQKATAATWLTIGAFGIGQSLFEGAKSVLSARAATAAIRSAVMDGALARGKGGYEFGAMTGEEFSAAMVRFVGRGAKLSRSGNALLSADADATFVARYPQPKTYGGATSRIIGNLEIKNKAGQVVINAHVPILTGPAH